MRSAEPTSKCTQRTAHTSSEEKREKRGESETALPSEQLLILKILFPLFFLYLFFSPFFLRLPLLLEYPSPRTSPFLVFIPSPSLFPPATPKYMRRVSSPAPLIYFFTYMQEETALSASQSKQPKGEDLHSLVMTIPVSIMIG